MNKRGFDDPLSPDFIGPTPHFFPAGFAEVLAASRHRPGTLPSAARRSRAHAGCGSWSMGSGNG